MACADKKPSFAPGTNQSLFNCLLRMYCKRGYDFAIIKENGSCPDFGVVMFDLCLMDKKQLFVAKSNI